MPELPKAYIASDVEKKWYQFWEQNELFKADPTSSKPAYCIMIPPPNVTGVLHMGHALVNTLQDILIRYKRMSGFDTLWMPGTDHAGISTQAVVERNIFQTTGKRRNDFERDDFLKIVWEWKEKSETQIVDQLKALGASCDWSRQRFTMDDGYCHAVRVMFKKLFSQGLIHRGDYLVNWDPVTQTALADDEVEYEEKQGFLWHYSYPLADGSGAIEIATTRPETMLGDTAIAVHPKDERYRKFIGKTAIQPLTGRHLIIVADDMIDPLFGTGAVKITPAHDHNDYVMGQRHNLEMITIMTNDGKINDNGGIYKGMSMQEARVAVNQAMKDKGYFVKTVPHMNRIGVSYRSKAVIEPHLSKQWFVKLTAYKDHLKEIVRANKVKILPHQWEATYGHWIDNLHDWCISRQLWWGHRIPIWYNRDNPEQMICYDGEGEPPEVQQNPDLWIQDPDVLDTWFSSSLWPSATLGWPENTPELKKYYPNATLITGHDILFFWVARMLMMAEAATGQVPFPETYLHGLIYGKSYWRQPEGGSVMYVTEQERKEFDLGKEIPKDVHSKWEKMSKSKGNIIDPYEIINEYGTDACRMALASSATSMPQIDLDRRRFEEFKNFANKIWNGTRFVLMNVEDLDAATFATGLDESLLTLEDRWILSRLNDVTKEVHKSLAVYSFDRATTSAYDFFWNEFCAYYLEIIKPVLFGKSGNEAIRKNKQKMLVIVLLQAVRLLHPMAPFITEDLFQQLKSRFETDAAGKVDPYTAEALKALMAAGCIVSLYPQPIDAFISKDAETTFNLLSKLTYSLRNIRGEMKVPVGLACDVCIIGKESDPEFALAKDHAYVVNALVKNKSLIFTNDQPSGNGSKAMINNLQLWVLVPSEMKEQEKQRLAKEEEKLVRTLEGLEQKLSNTSFLEKAPVDVVNKLKSSQAQSLTQLESIKAELAKL
ncbi:MAG: valine--tRNA ligase [Chlamydiales bacterium]|nr:valine--tRNA ligase [Chlamydiales bacterium]